MFQRIAMAASLSLCCLTANADPPRNYPTTAPNYVDGAANPQEELENQAVLKQLEKVVPDVDLNDARLSEGIDLFRKLSGLQVFVDWKSLEAAGIDRHMPIALHLKDKRLVNFLWLTLEIAGADREKLGFSIDDGIITISTLDDLAKNTVTRVYDMRQAILAPGDPGRDARIELILKLLMDTVDPDSWKAHGGNIGAIRELQGQLIVTQTRENQAKIERLVKSLNALAKDGTARTGT